MVCKRNGDYNTNDNHSNTYTTKDVSTIYFNERGFTSKSRCKHFGILSRPFFLLAGTTQKVG